ncbi:MAG: hypothetical protein ACP6IQ_00675 [Candidatus Njordarchaeia archaeon]|nr:hypothetical protein [Candidatus Korarchaeota archaeon]
MARERIIIKIAIQKLRQILRDIIKFATYNDSNIFKGSIFNTNLLSISIKFLTSVNKVSDLIAEAASRLEALQTKVSDIQSSIKNDGQVIWDGDYILLDQAFIDGSWANSTEVKANGDPLWEILYENHVYSTARALEALGIANTQNTEVIDRGVLFLDRFFQEFKLEEICDEVSKCVPIVQGLSNITNIASENIQGVINKLLDTQLNFVLEQDGNLSNIHAQDVYYLIKLSRGGYLNPIEAEPLYRDIDSGVFRKVLKGIEYLSMFGVELPLEVNEILLRMLPKYFSNIFRIGDLRKGAIYYSSLVESVFNILKYYPSKTIANTVMSLLIEDTGWIARGDLNPVDIFRTIIGSSLLVIARSAIRR